MSKRPLSRRGGGAGGAMAMGSSPYAKRTRARDEGNSVRVAAARMSGSEERREMHATRLQPCRATCVDGVWMEGLANDEAKVVQPERNSSFPIPLDTGT